MRYLAQAFLERFDRAVERGAQRVVGFSEGLLDRVGQVALCQRFQSLCQFANDMDLRSVRSGLGLRGVAKDQDRPCHIADFVGSIDRWNGDIDAPAGQIAHRACEFGDRLRDCSRKRHGEPDCDRDQHQPPDNQGDARGSYGHFLIGGIRGDLPLFLVLDFTQRQNGIADHHGLACGSYLVGSFGPATRTNHRDQSIAPLLAPFQGFLAGFDQQFQHLRIGEFVLEIGGDAVVIVAPLVIGFKIALIAGDEKSAELAVLTEDGSLERLGLREEILMPVVGVGRLADLSDLYEKQNHHDGGGGVDSQKAEAEFARDGQRFEHEATCFFQFSLCNGGAGRSTLPLSRDQKLKRSDAEIVRP